MKTLAIAALISLLGAAAHAADASAKKLSWSEYLADLKNRLTSSAVGEQRKAHGIVAAVRGKNQANKAATDPEETQLKGSAKDRKAKETMELDKKFENAVNLLIDKKFDAGIAALEDLQKNNPKYKTEDVQQALDGAKVELAAKNNQPVPEPVKKP